MLATASAPHEVELTDTDRLFFLHIPKTGGTTFTQFLSNRFDRQRVSPQYRQNAPDTWSTARSYQLIHAHVPYRSMCEVLGERPYCVTLLRDPVEHFLSLFAQNQRGASFDPARALDFEQFVRDAAHVRGLVGFDQQVHYLGGVAPLSMAEPLPAPGPDQIETARARLAELHVVGLTDRFQESIFLLSFVFGWRPELDIPRLNVGRNRLRREQLSAETLERILEFQAPDLTLYADGVRLFEARYELMVEDLLRRFGTADHARLPRPLPHAVVHDLLMRPYEQSFVASFPPSSKLRLEFDGPLFGSGWYAREQWPHGTVRWTCSGRPAYLDLPLAADADVRIRCRVLMAASPELWHRSRLFANGVRIRLYQRLTQAGGTLFEGWVPRGAIARRQGITRLELTTPLVPGSLPVSRGNGRPEAREIGLAVSWFEVEPAPRPPLIWLLLIALRGRIMPPDGELMERYKRLDRWLHEMYDRRMEPIYKLDDWQSRLRVRLALRTRLRRLLGRQSGSA